MAPNGSQSDLWERIREVEAVCNTCRGANIPPRIEALEKAVNDIKSELRMMALKIGLIVGLLGVLAQILVAVLQADAIRKMVGALAGPH